MDHISSPNDAAPSRQSIPDLDSVRSPSPIENRLFIPDLSIIRSPSPIQDRPFIPDLDILLPPSPIQDRPFIPDLEDIRSPSPIQNCQYIPDLDDVQPPSPIQDRPFVPDLDNVRPPSPIPDRRFIPDLEDIRSPSPIPDRPFIPDLANIPPPSPIQDCQYVPNLDAVRSPSPIESCPFVLDLNTVRSPSPIQDQLLIPEFKFLSLEPRPPVIHGSPAESHLSQVRDTDLSEDQDHIGRVTLMMDDVDLFFWSVTESRWFGPNALVHWRMWAKSHKMTIKLIEDLLDYPERYPALFKADVVPSCGLPQDNEGHYILPALNVDGEEIEPYLKVGLMGEESTAVPSARIPMLLEAREEKYRTVDKLDDLFERWDIFQVSVCQSDSHTDHERKRYVWGWQAHLRGCAGVPKLRMMETRKIKPGLNTSYFEIPYPDIPPHPETDLHYPSMELHDTEKLIANMMQLSEAIGDLRKCTSDVFGATRLSNNVMQSTL
ncbi:hypothetical protein QCA50_010250 [Cerrena zonata]|uniref:Uncharacterized protein n=1 Tax=Cerrena zonata TaxID=2478898 RepID=A0AAW0GC64_9APHY